MANNSDDAKQALHNAHCATNNSNNSSSSSTGAGIGYGPLSANASHGDSASSSQAASDCSSASNDQHVSAALYYAHSDYSDAIQAWSSCMRLSHELACWAEPRGDPDHLVVHVDWEILGPRPLVVSSNVQVGNRPNTPAFPPGTQLFLGDNLFNVNRNADTEDATIDLSGSDNNVSLHSCSVWVPKKEPIVQDIQGLWLAAPVNEPAPGVCSCVSADIPALGAGPFAAPYANDARAALRNDCGSGVTVWGRRTEPDYRNVPAPAPLTPAGRVVVLQARQSYLSQPLQPHQRLVANLAGATGVKFLVIGCPAGSFQTPASLPH